MGQKLKKLLHTFSAIKYQIFFNKMGELGRNLFHPRSPKLFASFLLNQNNILNLLLLNTNVFHPINITDISNVPVEKEKR